MPSQEALTLATQQYSDQAKIAAATALVVYESWQYLDLLDISGTIADWFDNLIPDLILERKRSAQSSAAFIGKLRAIEAGAVAGGFTPRPAATLNPDAIRASLAATGPAQIRALLARAQVRAVAVEQARAAGTTLAPGEGPPAVRDPATVRPLGPPTARRPGATPASIAPVARNTPLLPNRKIAVIQAATAKAAMRQVRNGGRDTADDAVRRDGAVVGYLRLTRATPCAFCAMLASRGPVYTADSFDRSDPRFTGPGDHKVHDNCGCTIMPLYSRQRNDLTDVARKADDLWRQYGRSKDGRSSLNNFRRAYESAVADGSWVA